MSRLREDDGGAIQAFEAVFAAIIILTALIFFSLVQRPAAPEKSTGLDLEQIATDALANAGGGLQIAVQKLLNGTAMNPGPVNAALAPYLPNGVHWSLSLDNGFSPLFLASSDTGSFAQPRGGQGATTYIALSVSEAGAGADANPGSGTGLAVFTPLCVDHPAGLGDSYATEKNGNVQTTSWLSLWQSVPQGVIPAQIPFGQWTVYNLVCGSLLPGLLSQTFHVSLNGHTAATPLYAVHLVVWTNV